MLSYSCSSFLLFLFWYLIFLWFSMSLYFWRWFLNFDFFYWHFLFFFLRRGFFQGLLFGQVTQINLFLLFYIWQYLLLFQWFFWCLNFNFFFNILSDFRIRISPARIFTWRSRPNNFFLNSFLPLYFFNFALFHNFL